MTNFKETLQKRKTLLEGEIERTKRVFSELNGALQEVIYLIQETKNMEETTTPGEETTVVPTEESTEESTEEVA